MDTKTGYEINLMIRDSNQIRLERNYITGVVSEPVQEPKSIRFNGCEFENEIYLVFEHHAVLDFSECKFHGKVYLEVKFPSSIINMSNAFLENRVELHCHKKVSLNCDGIRLSGQLHIENSHFSSANFNGMVIDEQKTTKFYFRNNTVENASFKESFFHNTIFNGSIFKSKISFDNSIFSYSIAPASGNFINVVFEDDAYFNSVVFDKWLFFNGSKFYGSFLLIGMNSTKNIDASIANFSGAIFYKRSFFDNSNFKSITFKNCEFSDVASFKHIVCSKLEVSKAIFLKGADFLNANVKAADRETFRIIKNEFLRINNQVEAIHFRSKEMKAYEKELREQRNYSELFLIYFNKISNNHGLSWFRGLCFTLTTAIISFMFYLLSLKQLPFQWGWKNFESYSNACSIVIKYFIRFLIITHDLDFMNRYQPSALSFLIDFICKIFIGFGIYQTIQAFRKYGKN
ncbi:MAG: hypothetical protein ABJA35_07225 [Parafilimonas sp.]